MEMTSVTKIDKDGCVKKKSENDTRLLVG